VHPLLRIPYAVAGATAQLAAALAPRSSGKLGASLRARREIRARYTDWGAAHRDPARPLLWIHAPSVGEGLQARPVIALLRARHPQLQIAYTFFSPSAAPFAEGIGADFCDYLPFDTFGDSDAAVRALRPTALVFSKLDVWPTLVERAVAHGVRVGLISATLAEESGRTSTFASWLLRDAYEALDAVGAIDTRDATRLIQLGARADRVHVTGDTRYDQVRERATAADRSGSLLAPLAGTRPTLVAGSTWPSDEAPLLKAWRDVRGRLPQARMIIAPHEPTDVKLAIIERWAEQSQLQLARIGSASQAMADVVLVDRVGVLGDLYALADVAFVGGGFHRAGLHSVLEPAAFGVPVLFGPQYRASRDATRLLADGGGFCVASAQELTTRMLSLFTETETRATAGGRARALVESGLGAALKSAALVEQLLAIS
jgi:3-deoxy-D-manno-octulosonic-acid transferase